MGIIIDYLLMRWLLACLRRTDKFDQNTSGAAPKTAEMMENGAKRAKTLSRSPDYPY